MSNPFAHASLVPLEVQIENVEIKLRKMIQNAETGAHWAAIADVEARQLVPLLQLQIEDRRRRSGLHVAMAAQPDMAPIVEMRPYAAFMMSAQIAAIGFFLAACTWAGWALGGAAR